MFTGTRQSVIGIRGIEVVLTNIGYCGRCSDMLSASVCRFFIYLFIFICIFCSVIGFFSLQQTVRLEMIKYYDTSPLCQTQLGRVCHRRAPQMNNKINTTSQPVKKKKKKK